MQPNNLTNQQRQSLFVHQVIGHNEQHNKLIPIKTIGVGQAPINIALNKYWGKRDEVLNLPMNGSVSISLPSLGTITKIQCLTAAELGQDEVYLNQQYLSSADVFAKRLSSFLNHFRTDNVFFKIQTVNTVPTAAGLASSASGYAALVLALNDLFNWQLEDLELSLLCRLGSGSASRSLFPGFALWHKGRQNNGMDSFAQAIDTTWPKFCVGLVKVDISQKLINSTVGMQNTVNTCDLYRVWPEQSKKDMASILSAIEHKDFSLLGQTAEHNALSMHATMMATWPPIVYWQPDSLATMQAVWKLRAHGIEVYFTIDAGPNLKLLFLEMEKPVIKQAFPDVLIIEPFKAL